MNLLASLFGEDADILHHRNFQVLLLANVLAPLGEGMVSPILESLIDPFGTTPASIGLVISAYTAPPILTIPIAGVLSDRYRRKPILVGSLLLFGAAGTAIAFTTDFAVVLLLRALQGVAFGGLVPIIITSLGDMYDGTPEATAQGVRFMGSGLAQTVFPLLSGAIVVLAWQYPFLLHAIAFPIAAVVALRFDEPTGGGGGDEDGGTTFDDGSKIRALFDLVSSPRVFPVVVGRGLPMMIWIGFLTYNSLIVVRIVDGTPAQAGMLVAIVSFTYAAAATQAGRLTGALGSRFYPLVGANVCMGAGFAFFLFAPTLSVAAVAVVIVGVGFGLALSLYRSIITGLAGESLRGSTVSVAESFGRLVATLTPVAMGAVIGVVEPTVGLRSAIQFAGLAVAAVSIVGGVVCLLSARRAAAPSPERA